MFAPLLKVPKPKAAPTRAPKPPHLVPRWLGGSLSSIPSFAPERPSRPEAPSPFWQPKLAIGQVNDPLEHEADRIADHVMRVPVPQLSTGAGAPELNRKCAAREDEKSPT